MYKKRAKMFRFVGFACFFLWLSEMRYKQRRRERGEQGEGRRGAGKASDLVAALLISLLSDIDAYGI